MPKIEAFRSSATRSGFARRLWVTDQKKVVVAPKTFNGHMVSSRNRQMAAKDKAAMTHFKAALKDAYGKEVANWAFSTIDRNKPLSSHAVTDAIQACETRIQTEYRAADASNLKIRKLALPPEHIFSSTAFKKIAGKPGFLSFTYRSLMNDLDALARDLDRAKSQPGADNAARLMSLKKKALKYADKKLTRLRTSHRSKKVQQRIENRLRAVNRLVAGIDHAISNYDANLTEYYGQLTGHDMRDAPFVPKNEESVVENFSQGGMSKLALINYKNGVKGVFKPIVDKGEMKAVSGRDAGIPAMNEDANLHGRSVASYRLNEALKLDLVPCTEFAVHGDRPGVAQQFVYGDKLIKTMAVADELANESLPDIVFGKDDLLRQAGYTYTASKTGQKKLDEARNEDDETKIKLIQELNETGHLEGRKEVIAGLSPIDFSTPRMQKALTDAHISDIVNGQVDRNSENFIFERAPDGGHIVRLIDNDLSFGKDFDDIAAENIARMPSPMLKTMPRLIDADTARKVLDMTPEALRNSLAGCGLTEPELAATVSRLEHLKAHIRGIQDGEIKGKIVDDWNAETFQELLEANDNYVSRCLDHQAAALLNAPNKVDILLDLLARHGVARLKTLLHTLSPDNQSAIFEADDKAGGRLTKALVKKGALELLPPDALYNVLEEDAQSNKGLMMIRLLKNNPDQLAALLLKIPNDREESADKNRSSLLQYFSEHARMTPQLARNAADVVKKIVLGSTNPPSKRLTPELREDYGSLLRHFTIMADGADPKVVAAGLRQAYSSGLLDLNMVDEFINELRTAMVMQGQLKAEDLDSLDLKTLSELIASPLPDPETSVYNGDDGASLIQFSGALLYDALLKEGDKDPGFRDFVLFYDDMVGRAIGDYNKTIGDPNKDGPVFNGRRDVRAATEKITPDLLQKLRTTTTKTDVDTLLKDNGWERVEGDRSNIKEDSAVKDFFYRRLFEYAADGRELT